AFWTGVGTAGLGQMVDSFLTSPEGVGTGFTTMAAYQAALNRAPTFAEFSAAVASVRAGAATVASLLASLNPGLTKAQVYQNLLGRAPVGAEGVVGPAAAFSTILASAEFQNTGGFRTAADHSNALYVRMLYYLILGRAPDTSGFAFWLGVANGGGSGICFNGAATAAVRLQILGPGTAGQGFVGSPEFQSHF
ncbi:MAG: DUF4214 domain-containing protein, partial [Acidobacteriia bacterium]|nr:DUF4214 domain-containing protein [Terriglobia bacterium]